MLTETLTFTQHYADQKQGPKGPWTKNSFVAEDGRRFETSKADIAAQVAAGLNFPQTIAFEQKVNGQYTNLIITGVLSSGVAPQTNGSVTTPAVQLQQAPTSPRDTSIQRQVAGKLAVESFNNVGIDSVEHVDAAVELAQRWADFFENGAAVPVEVEAESDFA